MLAPDLTTLEVVLLDLVESSIRAFAADHHTETFYGFGIDCNAEYGEVLLCLNTEFDLAQKSREYAENHGFAPDELLELRRSFGDWRYQGFNLEHVRWARTWERHQKAVEHYVYSRDISEDDRETYVEGFLRMACRVLIQIERSGALNSIRRDAGFFVLLMDHNDSHDEAATRLQDVRTCMGA